MSWFGRLRGQRRQPEVPAEPPPPTSAEIVASAHAVEQQIVGRVPAAVTARVHGIARTVEVMAPRLDRLGAGSHQAFTVVATATSYLPEAVGSYLRLPRDFADRRVVSKGKTSLMLLCDQLDLLDLTLDKISDAVSRQDADALVAHGLFLAEKFGGGSSLELAPDAGRDTPQAGSPVDHP
ncbi:hypothetical protein [Cellulomonas sp. URHE0023]|uniref:hypothetical protein n=1 Tax=Cellulomonas sp. URHE0023 TaxID=1380354 RepID=UPI00068CCE8B|nr:hypothetical protein [Cellulomonas sp. URHE0023]